VTVPVDRTNGGQFALIPAKVLYDDSLPATAKLLYGEIYRLSYANGYCYASNEDFMHICKCSEPTITRLVSKLKEAGHVRVKMIRRYGNAGDIIQRRIFCGQELAQEDPPEDPVDTSSGGVLKNDDTSPQKRLDGILKNDDHTNKKKNNKNTPISPEVLERVSEYSDGDAELQDAILGLLENRQKANKKPVKTVKAMSGILRELDKLSGGNRELKLRLLEKATTSNWLTVYPLKPDEIPRQQVREPERGGRFL